MVSSRSVDVSESNANGGSAKSNSGGNDNGSAKVSGKYDSSAGSAEANGSGSANSVRSEASGGKQGLWDYAKNHYVPTSLPQKLLLGCGAAVLALNDTHRGDMVGVVGEVFGEPSLKSMHAAMQASEEGREVLREKPRICGSDNFDYLRSLPSNTLGRAYVRFMDEHGYDPSERSQVRYVDNPELAYTMQRYREVHDVWHVLVGLPPTVLAEIGQKWLELLQTGLPMCLLSGLVGPLRLQPAERSELIQYYLPWAMACHRSIEASGTPLMSRYYERYLEWDLNEVREHLGVIPFHTFNERPPNTY